VKSKTKLAALTLALLLGACGKVGPLEPRAGAGAPAKAYGAEAVADAETLLTPSVQARPGRSDELMRRSERRTDDPFDLPPGGSISDTSAKDKPKEPPPPPAPPEEPKH
jgi:predicted small lipoprotein YifL